MIDPKTLSDEALKSHRTRIHTRAFLVMLEVAGLLAIPAALVVILRKTLEISLPLTYTLLGLAFVLSWVLIIRRTRSVGKYMRRVDDEMKRRDLFPAPKITDEDED